MVMMCAALRYTHTVWVSLIDLDHDDVGHFGTKKLWNNLFVSITPFNDFQNGLALLNQFMNVNFHFFLPKVKNTPGSTQSTWMFNTIATRQMNKVVTLVITRKIKEIPSFVVYLFLFFFLISTLDSSRQGMYELLRKNLD